MAAHDAGSAGWRALALDVRGPGARGRGRPPEAGPQSESFTAGDQGELWIQSGALYFTGRREAWSVPLGWLGTPETDLAGVTHVPIRSADRGHTIQLRLARSREDECGLAAAIRESRLAEPDPRDRRALDDLLTLVEPELRRLDAAAAAIEAATAQPEALRQYAAQMLAAAARLRSIWLPSWGDPASRLRDATLGVLIAAAEAASPDADAAAQQRHEQAGRRWRNVCEDLRDWCGLPAQPEALPAPRPPRAGAPAASAAQPDQAIPAAESAPAQPPVPPAEQAAAQERQAAAAAPAGSTAAPSPAPTSEVPAAIAAEPSASERDEEDQQTVLIAARGRVREPRPGEPVPEPDEDATLIAGVPPAARESRPPTAPSTAAATEAAQPSVVTGPGRRGSGGMTMLYRRSGPGPGGSIARKELQPEGVQTPDVAETFLRICSRFAAVHHPNFVRILGAGSTDEGTPYIDMEFVEGEAISARLKRGPLPREQALAIVDQLAGAIDSLHQAGLVHGDVRPQNVLLEPGGRVVLLEPSVACDYTLEQRRGTIYGELPYLTPERVRGEPAVPRSDIYTLATLAFALLAGRPPFEGEAADIFTGHAEDRPPTLAAIAPGTPAAASAVIDHALAKTPADRPATAAAFATALRRAITGTSEPADLASAATAAPTERIEREEAPGPSQPPSPSPSRAAPSPLGRAAPSPPSGGAHPPPGGDEDEPPDDLDKTIIVRPRR